MTSPPTTMQPPTGSMHASRGAGGHAHHNSSQSSSSHYAHHSHTRSGSTSFNPTLLSNLQPPLQPTSSNINNSNAANTTRILRLSNFDPALKTRDIHHLFSEWEEDRGGFKIKWADDVSCWIVFNDPATAKRAYLNVLVSPPPALQPNAEHTPSLTPYSGPDATSIITAVQNRPRSRSNAGSASGGHSRKSSLMGSGGAGIGSNGPGNGSNGGAFGTHGRSGSFGRSPVGPEGGSATTAAGAGGSFGSSPRRSGSFGQREAMVEGRATPPVPSIPDHLVGSAVVDSESSLSSSPSRGGRISPEIYRRTAGIDGSPRHRKSESRAGVDVVANAIEGMTIAEEGRA